MADLNSAFVDSSMPAAVLVARDLAPPVRVHFDPKLTPTQRLALVVDGLGADSVRRVPVFLPLPAAATSGIGDFWSQVVRSLGGNPLVVQRPLAAAAALGLEMPGRSHLMIETGDGMVEAAVVVDGVVASSRLIGAREGGWRTVLETVAGMLAALDPDEELDIRDEGMHLYGPGGGEAAFLAEMSGLNLADPAGDDLSVVIGTQRIAREALGYLVL